MNETQQIRIVGLQVNPCSSNFRVEARTELECCVNDLNMCAGDAYNYSGCYIEPVTQECRTSTITLR